MMTSAKPVKRYFTVVFEITNEENFTGMFAGPFTKSLAEDSDIIEGVKVVSCGRGDTMTAYDALHDLTLELGHNPDQVVREYCEANDDDAEAVIG
jgi:hypothetical protein